MQPGAKIGISINWTAFLKGASDGIVLTIVLKDIRLVDIFHYCTIQ